MLLESGDIACVIMEPMSNHFPAPGFLEQVRSSTTKFGAVLIFDETITGFRFARGGAQELFGVKPDLSTFGKGMANGFPLSAVVGKREIMMEMQDIFFSGTFGGELLSLAAAKRVLQMHIGDEIVPKLIKNGQSLANGTEELIRKYGLTQTVSLSGHNSWKFLHWEGNGYFTAAQIRTYFLQEVFARGLLVLGTHNVTTRHTGRVVRKILNIYDEVFQTIDESFKSGDLIDRLKVEPLTPLFKVR
jgi:glutamate-1-semialdehyde 2,1-aminomutase